MLALVLTLSFAVIGLSVRVLQLRRDITHAELYVQAGVANWELVCKSVATNLQAYSNDAEASSALHMIAFACVARSDTQDLAGAEALSRDMDAKDPAGLIRRIERAIETRDYGARSEHVTGYFPKGY
jgi:hypothetical protein